MTFLSLLYQPGIFCRVPNTGLFPNTMCKSAELAANIVHAWLLALGCCEPALPTCARPRERRFYRDVVVRRRGVQAQVLSTYAPAPALALAPKGRLMFCTVDGSTPNRFAILRTPGRPGSRVQLGQEGHKVLQAAAQPIHGPSHYDVELPPIGVTVERIKARPLVPVLGAAGPVILVDLNDFAAHAAGDFPQHSFLIGRGLLRRGDAKVGNGPFHRSLPDLAAGDIAIGRAPDGADHRAAPRVRLNSVCLKQRACVPGQNR
jgi:hypothetical protein